MDNLSFILVTADGECGFICSVSGDWTVFCCMCVVYGGILLLIIPYFTISCHLSGWPEEDNKINARKIWRASKRSEKESRPRVECRLGETLILNDGSPTSLAPSLIQIDSDNDLGLLILQIRILTLVVRSMNYKLLLNNVIVIDLWIWILTTFE